MIFEESFWTTEKTAPLMALNYDFFAPGTKMDRARCVCVYVCLVDVALEGVRGTVADSRVSSLSVVVDDVHASPQL